MICPILSTIISHLLGPNLRTTFHVLELTIPVIRNMSGGTSGGLSSTQVIEEKFLSYWIIIKLNKSKGDGLDKIPNRIICECSYLILSYISINFNLSLSTGVFPGDWKSANLLLYLSRAINVIWIIIVQFQLFLQWLKSVFERIVYNQLFSYLNERINILSNHQSGFRSLHSTMTTLLEATDNWALNIDRGFVNTACCISSP